ncbi:uncharacterized protein LOC143282510 isoform X2 [Babylonia areolata]|uniref:uncharacterized protein LOC143282510 isoform X2 n=1 Tax=Babylonia areolata TaxID=304850 RepID=UPI003FD5F9BC
MEVEQREMKVGVGQVRQGVMNGCITLLSVMLNIRVKMNHRASGEFRSERQQATWSLVHPDSWERCVRELLGRIFPPGEEDRYSLYDVIAPLPNETSVSSTLGSFRDFCLLCGDVVKGWGVPPDLTSTLPFSTSEPQRLRLHVQSNRLHVTWNDGDSQGGLLSAVEAMLTDIRNFQRAPTCDEYLVTHLANQQARKDGGGGGGWGLGRKGSRKVCPLGSPGFHPHAQTYLSLTNSGEGHVQGTSRRADWLRGALVHVEHIERPLAVCGSVEAYRMPALLDVECVRLHVGTSAPTTCYIGRVYRDSKDLQDDFVKVVHVTAAAVSQAFSLGVAECKLSMFLLPTSLALQLMRALGALVTKTPHQVMSAAWSLTHCLLDDLQGSSSGQTHLSRPVDIALRAVEVTSQGGFEKVTWDGSGATCPSKCVLQQLSPHEALAAVHAAHERGLLTYFSAGIGLEEIPLAVRTGVDGVGVGGVLHLRDSSTGCLGPFREELIPGLLAARDEAEAGVLGRGALLLARLDTMYFEGSITSRQDHLRFLLYHALQDQDEARVEELITQLRTVASLQDEDGEEDGCRPFYHRAKRLLESPSPALRQACSAERWDELRAVLKPLVEQGDEEGVAEEYEAEPWLSARERRWTRCRSQQQTPANTDPHHNPHPDHPQPHPQPLPSTLLPLRICTG